VGIPLQESLRMASTYPAEVLNLEHLLGAIKPDYQANMVIFDDDFVVRGIVEEGCLEWF
jgi:N-acetylglucosamine-6-phosphate deacetylase